MSNGRMKSISKINKKTKGHREQNGKHQHERIIVREGKNEVMQ